MFYAVEAVRGQPLSERAQEAGFRIGLAIVVLLLVYTTYRDRFIRAEVDWDRLTRQACRASRPAAPFARRGGALGPLCESARGDGQ